MKPSSPGPASLERRLYGAGGFIAVSRPLPALAGSGLGTKLYIMQQNLANSVRTHMYILVNNLVMAVSGSEGPAILSLLVEVVFDENESAYMTRLFSMHIAQVVYTHKNCVIMYLFITPSTMVLNCTYVPCSKKVWQGIKV